MTMMTDEQIRVEFERQVRLCSGIGKDKMLEIIERYYADKTQEVRKHKWRFYMNGTFCERCGISVGQSKGNESC